MDSSKNTDSTGTNSRFDVNFSGSSSLGRICWAASSKINGVAGETSPKSGPVVQLDKHGELDHQVRGLGTASSVQIDKIFTLCEAPTADLVLQLTTESERVIQYQVCRSPLALASPIFSKMLDPNSRMPSVKLGKNSEGKDLDLLEVYDDNPEAMLVFLAVVHFRSQYVPSSIGEFNQLVALAVLCDKYNCASAFDCIMPGWLEHWIELPGREMSPSIHYNWLLVAVVFGEPRNFREITLGLAKEISQYRAATGSGRLTIGKFEVDNHDIPEKIIQSIMQERNEAFVRLIYLFRDMMDCLKRPANLFSDKEIPVESRYTKKAYTCSDICIGSLYGCFLRQAQLSPVIFQGINTDRPATLISQVARISVDECSRFIRGCIEALESAAQTLQPSLHPPGARGYGRPSGDLCGLATFSEDYLAEIAKIESLIRGLDHADFVRYTPQEGKWTKI